MILVSVRRAEEIAPARALLTALGRDWKFFLLFGKEELRDGFGELSHRYGFDPVSVVLNADQFELMVSFGGWLDPAFVPQLLLLSFFEEIGVPTLEIQHTLFQDGVDASQGPPGELAPAASALRPGYASTLVLRWEGKGGIGYIESEQVAAVHDFVRADQVLVTSNNAWQVYGEKQRMQFAIAVVKLASSQPEISFVWKPQPAELQHAEANAIFRMVDDYKLENLQIARDEPLADLRSRCRLAISMISKDLLDYQLSGKPVLVYQSEVTDVLASGIEARGFHHYHELEELWPAALERPQDFLVDCRIPPLDRERLVSELRRQANARRLVPGWVPVAIRYIAYLREGRAARIELGKLQPEIAEIAERTTKLETRMAAIEADLAKIQGVIAQLPSALAGLGQRLTTLQRSTWAYKAKHWVARLNKPGAVDD